MDTEAPVRSSRLELPQENHLLPSFLDRDVEVLDSLVVAFEVVEFVVMGREESFRSLAVFVDVLHDSPGDAHPVVGRGASSDFVQQHKRAGREIVQYHAGFQHLHHESGFSPGDVVRRPDPREYLVEVSEPCRRCRYETAALGHKHDKGCLAQESGFSGHVRARQDDDLLALAI